jgi:hypothetical protein
MASLLVFMSAGIALNLTPGPDMLYVAARASGEGRASGVASALGIAVGAQSRARRGKVSRISFVAAEKPRLS